MTTTYVGPVSATAVDKASGVNTVDVPLPVGSAAGDVCVAGLGVNGAFAIGTQTGFTTLASHRTNADTLAPSGWAGVKVLTGTDITNGHITLDNATTAVGEAGVMVFHGMSTTQDITAVWFDKSTATDGLFSFPTQTLTQAGVTVAYVISQATVATGVITPPSGFTKAVDGGTKGFSMGYKVFTASGATGAMTASSTKNAVGVGLLVAFRSAASTLVCNAGSDQIDVQAFDTATLPLSASGGTGPYTFTVVADDPDIDVTVTGSNATLVAPASTTADTHVFTVTAHDSLGATATDTVSVTFKPWNLWRIMGGALVARNHKQIIGGALT